jgi:molybdopterin converting factor small subunit
MATDEKACSVHVLLFSVLREAVGRSELVVRLAAPATGEDLLDGLAAVHPAVGRYRRVVRLAVNQAYVGAGVRLEDGDEVALITPVSGG